MPTTSTPICRPRASGRRSDGEAGRECVFCSKKFYRSDILRRHYTTCPSRATQPLPRPLKKGKRRKACDCCAKAKLSCDFDSPCESCLARNTSCTYQRVGDDTTSERVQIRPGAAPSGFSECSNEQCNQSNLHSSPSFVSLKSNTPELYLGIQHRSKTSIPFLLNYTNPENRSLRDTFGFSSDCQAIFPLHFQKILDDYESALLSTDGSLDDLFPGYFFPDNASERRQLEFSSYPMIEFDSLPGNPSPHLPGLSRTNEVVDHLTEISLSLPKYHPESAPNANLVSGVSLFSSTNIQRLVEIYFHQWHRHSPIVHSGTFDMETISLPLLISVVLTGALYSPLAPEVEMARKMLNLAEECAFQDRVFLRLVSGEAPESCCGDERCLEALQAAFSMAQIQLREGSPNKRKYSKFYLFDQVINAARSMSLTKTQNLFYHEPPSSFTAFDWKVFALAEAKIRLACGLFGLVASFTILYNMPPRLRANELSFDMPCSVATYLAQNSQTCYEAALDEPLPHVPPLDLLLGIFLANKWDTETCLQMRGITVLHLFVLILAILQELKLEREPGARGDRIMLSQILGKWKAMWDMCILAMNEQQLEQAGFTRLAAIEFWHMANLLVSN